MSADVVKYAFIAGEISPTLFGRTDLTKYDLGMALARNFFVDYRGGLSSRPGFEFNDFIKNDQQATKFFPFAFSPDLSNTYAVLFGHGYIRFVQDGGYVLEAAKNIVSIAAGVVTVTAHGLTSGRWVKLSGLTGANAQFNGRSAIVTSTGANTFTLTLAPDGAPMALVNTGAVGQSSAIYEVASPYNEGQLAELNATQRKDLLRLTHSEHPIRSLIRHDHADWELVVEDVGVSGVGPTITSVTPSAAGSAEAVFAVTAIFADGSESAQGPSALGSAMINYTTEAGSAKVTWTAVAGAVKYNVYRSVVSEGSALDQGAQLGYLGSSIGTTFVDSNIIPDYSKAPPVIYDPFEPGAVRSITVTGGGTGYGVFTTSVSVSGGGGSGFVGKAIVNASGVVVNVEVLNPGKGYSSPVVSFTTGTGATATAELAPASGLYPSLSAFFQQRQIYAASLEDPVTVWGSQPKLYDNFNSNERIIDSDSFEFELDSNSVAPIRHMLVTRGGLLLMTQENVWLLNGGAAGASLTPTNALADPQTFNGVSQLDPIFIGSDILYTEGKGFAVRMLAYNEISRVYGGEDRSILANHLFGPTKTVISWAFQESPFKVVWGVRSDGAMVAFTTVKEQDVYAWTQCNTLGLFQDVVNIREGVNDRIYVVTKRLVNGRWTKFLERMALREYTRAEDAWCVDAALANPLTIINAQLQVTITSETTVSLVSDMNVFTGKEGYIVRASGGIFRITTVVSPTEAEAMIQAEPTAFIPEDTQKRLLPVPTGGWYMDPKVTTFSGLWHLEGETVSVLGDGNVFPQETVVNGSVTLPNAVSRAVIGLPFRAVAQTLPMIVAGADIEGKRKRVVEVGVRLDSSRGLKSGRTLDEADLYPIRERTTEDYGQPIRLFNGVKHAILSSNWDDEGQTYFVQDDPLPVTLLGLVSSIEVGDDPD